MTANHSTRSLRRSGQLYKVNEEFYDIPASTLTSLQIREKALDVGTPILGKEKVAEAKEVDSGVAP